MTATLTFKTKLRPVLNMDNTHAWTEIHVPVLTRAHCDMNAFRQHKRYGGIANSDLFKNALTRIRNDVAPNGWIKLEQLPDNVTVDTSGFLAKVTITV